MNWTIHTPDERAMRAAKARWDAVAKPLNSLGELEKAVVRVAGMQADDRVNIAKRCVLVFCADHGVVAEGVTQSPSSVTASVARSLVENHSNVNLMAQVAGAEVFPVDVGMFSDVPGMIQRKTKRGTNNMTREAAMTREEAGAAVQAGIDLVGEMKARGYRLIVTGEMGIGNTTASAAVVCALLNVEPEAITGRGAGLSDAGLRRKIQAIRTALFLNAPDPDDAIDVLSKVGGLEIAAMTGAFLGGMTHRLPVVIDGTISAAAALAAEKLCRESVGFMLPSHMSREGAAPLIMRKLGLTPVVYADMALGEGTGGVLLLPMLDMALRVYNGTHTFTSLGMEPYAPLGGNI